MGTMRVNLRIHGGNQALLNVLSGLVVRNERAIREGTVPLPEVAASRIRQAKHPIWMDAPTSFAAGVATAGTMAAWMAAGARVKGYPARMTMVSGIPSVLVGDHPETGAPTVSGLFGPSPSGSAAGYVGSLYPISAPSASPLFLPRRSPVMDGPENIVQLVGGRQNFRSSPRENAYRFGGRATINPLAMALTPGVTTPNGLLVNPSYFAGFRGIVPRDFVGALSDTQGRVDEWMTLTLDDEDALPIREIGDAIALHNAHQRLASRGQTGDNWKREIPSLYKSGVVYKVEGSPEIWKDARETLIDGHDDCEGLAAYRAGDLLLDHDTLAQVWTRQISRPEAFPSGTKPARLFHAVTRFEDAQGKIQFDDPSRRLGMPVPEWYSEYASQRRASNLPI